MKEVVTVEAQAQAPIAKVWECFTNPEQITKWNNASEDWHTPQATNDLRVGGTFRSRMEAKDGSAGFDFTGTYEEVVPHTLIRYKMDDGRHVREVFEDRNGSVHITISFEPETENPLEMQRSGWQAILTNFKKYVENLPS